MNSDFNGPLRGALKPSWRDQILNLMALCFFAGLAASGLATPLKLHPLNPRYFLFRNQPTVLITSAEHYGAVLNLDFDYVPYLDELQAQELNYTRIFAGPYCEMPGAFNIEQNTLAPAALRFIAPWARSATPGYYNGGNKFDLTSWDTNYFARLKDFVAQAGSRGIVVEVTLFCNYYNDDLWRLSPLNATNNINGIGAVTRAQALTLSNAALVAAQDAYVQKMVTELQEFDNVLYEICNEPYVNSVPANWQAHIAQTIAATESGFTNRHLIAQNVGDAATVVSSLASNVSVANFHYATPQTAANNFGLNCVLGDDETGFAGSADFTYRAQGWEFILAGGALYNNLDYSFTATAESGTATQSAPGGGSPALRRQLGILKRFVEKLDFVSMTPSNGVIVSGVPSGAAARALINAGSAYAVYLKGGTQANLVLNLAAGSYEACWINPKTGVMEKSERFTHAGGNRTVVSPAYSEDVALRILAQSQIMPLGDSLTAGSYGAGQNGIGGYRTSLWTNLAAAGYFSDFVGSVTGPAPANVDPQHEGHPSWRNDQLSGTIDSWFATNHPDVVLLLAGANDLVQGASTDTAIGRFTVLLDKILAARPTALVLVGSLPPARWPNDYSYAPQAIQDYNARIPALVDARMAQGRRIKFVDLHAEAGLIDSDFSADGLHPNDQGYDKIAAVWFAALQLHLPAPATLVSLAVSNGSGSGSYLAGAPVTITANPPPSGSVFDHWVIVAGNPILTNPSFASTTLTMSNAAVTIAATYKAGMAGRLSGAVTSQVYSNRYNLTALGTSDWADWGYGGVPGLNRKATGGGQIGPVTFIGGGHGWANNAAYPARLMSWSDGTPLANATDSYRFLYTESLGAGYSFTVPASTHERTLYILTGGYQSQSRIQATLSDGSAADYVSTQGTLVGQNYQNLNAITYRAGSDGRALTLNYTKVGGPYSIDLMAAWIVVGPLGRFLSSSASHGQVVLNWTGPGMLESAPTVSGPWTPVVPIPASPYSAPVLPGQDRFFRLVSKL